MPRVAWFFQISSNLAIFDARDADALYLHPIVRGSYAYKFAPVGAASRVSGEHLVCFGYLILS